MQPIDWPRDPVVRLVAERAREGSRPGQRSDGARVALVVEGGGMAGAVTAGMCAALEARGLIDSFDLVYGSSAGAINASYAIGRQARERSGLYELAARERLVDLRRAALLRPPFRLAEIGARVLGAHPHDPAVLDPVLPLRVTAARVREKQLDVLGGFGSLEEMRTALLASCANPILTGEVVELRGRRYVDGGLIEPMPFRAALREGATHVLALRSRHPGYRAPDFGGIRGRVLRRLLRGAPDTVVEMVLEWPERYNADAHELQAGVAAPSGAQVSQLTPLAEKRSTSSYETRPSRLRRRIALGAMAAYGAFSAVA